MQYYMLKEVCVINPSKQIDLSPDDKISFVPMDSVSVRGDIDTSKSISVSSIKTYSVFREGDVLFAKITPCMENGKGCIAHGLLNGYGAGSTEFIVLRPDSRLLMNKWLYYFLSQQNFRQECKQHMTGSAGQKRVPPKYLGSCSIPVPSISEQQRIVARIEELFSQLDDAEATLQKTKAQLALYRQAVYASAYKGLEANRSINEFFDITGGITKNSTRGSMQNKRPYLRVANVYYNRLDLSEIKEIGVTDAEIEKCTLMKNDLLFVEGNGSKSQIGRVAIWDGSIPNIVHQNHIIKGRPNGKMFPEFALFYLMSFMGRRQISDVAKSTSGLYTLSTDKVRKLKVPYCQEGEQRRVLSEISSRISICESIEQVVDKAIIQNQSLRMSILTNALKGE